MVSWKKSLLTFNKIVLSFPSGPHYNKEMICVTAEMCEVMFCTTKQYLHLHIYSNIREEISRGMKLIFLILLWVRLVTFCLQPVICSAYHI